MCIAVFAILHRDRCFACGLALPARLSPSRHSVMNNYESISIVGRGAHGVCHLCRRIGDSLRQKVIIKKIAIDGVGKDEEKAIMGK